MERITATTLTLVSSLASSRSIAKGSTSSYSSCIGRWRLSWRERKKMRPSRD
eukprot:SAG11_NODE_27689_length_330_cov_0.675325_1_plen_51_part_10